MSPKKTAKPDINVLDMIFSNQYVKILVDIPITEHTEEGSRTDITVFFGYYLGSDAEHIYVGGLDHLGMHGVPQFALNKRYVIVIELSEPKTEQDIILDEVKSPKEDEIN